MKYVRLFEEFLNETLLPIENYTFDNLKKICIFLSEEIRMTVKNIRFYDVKNKTSYSFEVNYENTNYKIWIDSAYDNSKTLSTLGIHSASYSPDTKSIILLISYKKFITENILTTKYDEFISALIAIIGHELMHYRQFSERDIELWGERKKVIEIATKMDKETVKWYNDDTIKKLKAEDPQTRLEQSILNKKFDKDLRIIHDNLSWEISPIAWSSTVLMIYFLGKEETKKIISEGNLTIKQFLDTKTDLAKNALIIYSNSIENMTPENSKKFRKRCYEYYEILIK